MKFQGPAAYGSESYSLLPLRFRRLPWDENQVLLSSISGDWLVIPFDRLAEVIDGRLSGNDPLRSDLEARHFIAPPSGMATLAPVLSQIRTRKSFLFRGPSLHIFVVSLRCHHTCSYCQVSRQPEMKTRYDMSDATAKAAVDRLFEWPSRSLTVEFQGGEPLLNFEKIRSLTRDIVARNESEKRQINFVVASTLHDLTDKHLEFFSEHGFMLSTSLDGPEWLHNANRPRPERDSYRRSIEGIERARRALGEESVSALTTITKKSLSAPSEIVDEYRKLGFHSIFLRPISPYGFALKSKDRTGYTIAEFLRFYEAALDRILKINRDGYVLEEAYAGLVLSQLLTPFPHGYVDLRSPTGAGLGAMVYDYDGHAYPSDEARMLAAMGDHTFRLGRMDEPVAKWLASDAMRQVLEAGVAEALPTCADCVFVPWCGSDPIDHYARQRDTIGHRPSSEFCHRQTGFFDLLLRKWQGSSIQDRSILESWSLRNSGAHVSPAGKES